MLTGSYSVSLVLTSLGIAMLASYTALDMAGRVAASQGRVARFWLLGGSVAMGIGIWSMHFLGMLAFSLSVPMGYDPLITFLSLLIAIASSAFALCMVCGKSLSRLRLATGALIMGAGVSAMHYAGMAAMRMQPAIHYVPWLFLLSIVIAVTASGTALWIAFHLRRRTSKTRRLRAGAAVVMGCAIAGMHYTGMAAARFPQNSICMMAQTGSSTRWMAPIIIVFAVAVLSIALITSMLDFRMQARTATLNSSLSRAHEELHFLALHDNLTKLPNRTLLEDRLDQEIANSRRSKNPFSVLFLDLDGFKQINDAYGHQVGDLLLVEVAQRIRSVMRARDTVARIGGDEFVLLSDTGEPADAAGIASKLIVAVQQPFILGALDCQVTVSIGIAICDGAQCERQDLLKAADVAMYHAKALGRNTFCFFEISMNKDAHQQLQMLQDLRLALERQDLVLHYQPKFDAHSRAMLGVEALIRWQHPTRGLIPPGEFIPLAEKIGLIVPIGHWAVQEACRQLAEWRAMGHTSWTMAVNLSAVEFKHPYLVELVRSTLERFELDPGSLVLEITESTAMNDPDASLSILEKLHAMGVRISIDDFGTGYSSLLYLKRLPASELKIDRAFLRELAPGSEDAAIIAAIVALGQTLNLEVVAEGVETHAQQEFLTRLGCNSLQGFLLGRPIPPEEFLAAMTGDNPTWDLSDMALNQPISPRRQIPATTIA